MPRCRPTNPKWHRLQTLIPAWQEARAGFGRQFKSMAQDISFIIAAKSVEDKKKPEEKRDDLAAFANLREEFMRYASEADPRGRRGKTIRHSFSECQLRRRIRHIPRGGV